MKLRTFRLYQPSIRNFKQRQKWGLQNSDASILAFYNTGDGLFIDPHRLPAYAHHSRPWQWMRFADYETPKSILASDRKIAGLIDDIVPFQTLGHTAQQLARIRIGAFWDGEAWVIHHMPHMIPPLCILYVSVRYGKVVDTLLVCQPLPGRLMKKL